MKRKTGKQVLSLLLVFLLSFGNIQPFFVNAEAVPEVRTETDMAPAEETHAEPELETQPELQPEMNEEADSELQPETQPDIKQEESKEADDQEAGKTGMGITVTLRVEGLSKTLVSERRIVLPDTYKSLKDYGLESSAENGVYTPLHALAQYCENQGISAADAVSESGGNINSFQGNGGSGSFLMFVINNQCPMDDTGMGYLFGTYPLKEGDSIVLYDFAYSGTSAYAYFENENIEAAASETVEVKVHVHDGMGGYNQNVNARGAALVLEDESGNRISEEKYTAEAVGEDGIGKITVKEPGDYRLTVERKGADGRPDLSRAYAELHIEEAESLSDEEAVNQAAAALEAEFAGLSEITESVLLPDTGKYGTHITWKSLAEEFISNDGTLVKRPAGTDHPVEMEASVSRNGYSQNIVLKGKIKGYYLRELSVSPGDLEFDAGVRTYTVYVPEDTKTVKVFVNAGEEASMAAINGQCIFGGREVAGEKEVELSDGETVIEVQVQFPDSDGMQTLAEISVRKSVPGKPLPELPAVWPQHYGNSDNNAVVDKTTAIKDAELAWSLEGEAVSAWSSYAGHPVIVNGDLYVARGQKLQIIDSGTGEIKKSTELALKVGYYSYLTYGEGKIFVPLTNGQVQCFHASTLESLFITEVPGEYFQGLSSIFYQDGMIYTGFSTGSGDAGLFAAYSAEDTNVANPLEAVSPVWSFDTGKGYYGSGAVAVNDGKHLVFSGDAGIMTVADAKDGNVLSEITLAGATRSAIVSADGFLWAASKSLRYGETAGNKWYKLSVNEEGKIQKVAETGLPDNTVASPVVARGKVIIGGGAGMSGFLQVYDTDLNLLSEIQTGAEVKSPTVTTAYDELYVYFVQNSKPGGLYIAKIASDNTITMTMLHEPEQQNYSMSNVLVGEDGTLYYANDSGYMFALKPGEKQVKPDPEPVPDPAPDPEPAPEPGTVPEKEPEQEKKPETEKEPRKNLFPKQNSRISPQLLQGRRNLVLTSANVTEETATEKLVKSIQERSEAGETSITVKNPPETIEADVFAKLQEHPEMKLILDCGSYTISIEGKDILHEDAVLSTKIRNVDASVTDEWEEKLGIFEQYTIAQAGELPGKITVVLTRPEVLKGLEDIYLYRTEDMSGALKTVTDSEFIMFTLEEKGDFILAEKDAFGNAEEVAVSVDVKTDPKTVEQEKDSRESSVNVAAVCIIVAGVVILIVIAGIVLAGKRRKEKTWE